MCLFAENQSAIIFCVPVCWVSLCWQCQFAECHFADSVSLLTVPVCWQCLFADSVGLLSASLLTVPVCPVPLCQQGHADNFNTLKTVTLRGGGGGAWKGVKKKLLTYRVWDKQDKKDARVLATAVSTGRHFQSTIVRGNNEDLWYSVLRHGTGQNKGGCILGFCVIGWGSLWLAWCVQAVFGFYSNEVMVEFVKITQPLS